MLCGRMLDRTFGCVCRERGKHARKPVEPGLAHARFVANGRRSVGGALSRQRWKICAAGRLVSPLRCGGASSMRTSPSRLNPNVSSVAALAGRRPKPSVEQSITGVGRCVRLRVLRWRRQIRLAHPALLPGIGDDLVGDSTAELACQRLYVRRQFHVERTSGGKHPAYRRAERGTLSSCNRGAGLAPALRLLRKGE